MLKNILIVGGTSGLGLELAERYAALGQSVFVTGRKDPARSELTFLPLSITANSGETAENVRKLKENLPQINTLVYAAGFYQEGHIDDLKEEEILTMVNTGLVAPSLLVHHLKNNPGKPLKVMLVTSSSQYTPRELEPIYTATKAGLGMLGASLSIDPGIGKVLVVAPSGMKTPFWSGTKDVSEYLDPGWAAEEIIRLSSGPFKYKFAKILRNPARTEVVETRM